MIPSKERYLLANAYYGAGSSVIDFSDPRNPVEVAYGDREAGGTWSTYWYETDPSKHETVDVYANDGVGVPIAGRNGFEAWSVTLGKLKRLGLPYLNPQTQEEVVRSQIKLTRPKDRGKGRFAKGRDTSRKQARNPEVLDHLATG